MPNMNEQEWTKLRAKLVTIMQKFAEDIGNDGEPEVGWLGDNIAQQMADGALVALRASVDVQDCMLHEGIKVDG